jgi:ketosteroid isomerase-like protein
VVAVLTGVEDFLAAACGYFKEVLRINRERFCMVLSREEIESALRRWHQAWAEHDLDGVMALFHEEILFENWTGGQAAGRENLRRAWSEWFGHHGGFRFIEEDTFIDEREQKVLYRWKLEWPSIEKGWEGKPEKRRGVDVLHFKDGRIIQKLTYSKTTIDVDGQRVRLIPKGSQ